MLLSNRNNKIQTTARPQSPQVAGMQVTIPPGSQIPSGWVELNGQTLVGAETEYPDLWLNAPTAWKSGSDLVLPYGEVESAWTDLSPYVDSTSGSPVIARLLGKARRDSGGQWYIDINGNGTKANLASEAIFNMAADSMKFQDLLSVGSSYNADSSQAQINSTPQRIRTGPYPSNFSAWTVSFSDVRASGRPNFVESVGTPCIKLYSDTTSAVSVGIKEATATQPGVVKANRSQTKTLTSNITNPTSNTTFLTFSNLIIGKRYKLTGQLYQSAITTGNNSRIELTQNLDSGNRPIFDLYAVTGAEFQTPINVEFTATNTIVEFNVYSAYTGIIAGITGGFARTWATLTEINNTVSTTDFT